MTRPSIRRAVRHPAGLTCLLLAVSLCGATGVAPAPKAGEQDRPPQSYGRLAPHQAALHQMSLLNVDNQPQS